jgi:hypothetical protein
MKRWLILLTWFPLVAFAQAFPTKTVPSSRSQLTDLIRADTAKFAELVRKTGATID